MGLTLSGAPGPLIWSKNYTEITVSHTLMTVGWKVRVEFVDYDTNQLISGVEYPVRGASGDIRIKDIEKLLDAHVQYAMPFYTGIANSELASYTNYPGNINIKRFRIRARPSSGDTVFSYTDFPGVYAIMKGGISHISPALYNVLNVVGALSPYWFPNMGSRLMTWVPTGADLQHVVIPDEWAWLLYLSTQSAAQKLRYQVWYKDNTSAIFNRTMDNPFAISDWKYKSWFIPTGIVQAKLDPLNKGVMHYQVDVLNNSTDVSYAHAEFMVDTREYNKTLTLYYRNSFGGLDQVSFRGVILAGAGDISKKEHTQHTTVTATNMQGNNPYYDSTARVKLKGNTGYISAVHKAALFDLMNTTAAYAFIDGLFLPMRVPAQEPRLLSSQDDLHDFSIDFETADAYRTLPPQLMKFL